MSSDSQAQSMVEKLDNAEKTFAQLSSSPKVNKAAVAARRIDRLESMLSRLHETYSKKKDDCIEQIDNGGQCDYTVPEQVALAAAYPLAWLRFQGASTVYTDNPERAKKLLNQAIDDFTQSSLAMPGSEPGARERSGPRLLRARTRKIRQERVLRRRSKTLSRS